MSRTAHRIYIGTMVFIVLLTTIYLSLVGKSYYQTSLEERFYHPDHKAFKPSGIMGHTLGIVGTLLILIGVFGYQARKYMKALSKVWVLKHWLEFHIFLCTLGPIMILFHTSFKFGGIVSVSFWSMVAVVASGVAGRFIYLQIPRTIQGRELSLHEIKALQNETIEQLKEGVKGIDLNEILGTSSERKSNLFLQYFTDLIYLSQLKNQLKANGLSKNQISKIAQLVQFELGMSRKIERLALMQKLFHYWHIIHLPFAIIMLVIMVIHVGVTIAFGYKWIF